MIVALCCNESFAAYNFRLSLIKTLISKGYKLYVICGYDEFSDKLINQGIKVINIKINKTGKNIFSDIRLYLQLKKIYKKIKPDLIINYTVKLHIFSPLAARKDKIKVINFVAGVGSMFLEDSLIRKLIIFLYRVSSQYVLKYIFINKTDLNDFSKFKITKNIRCFLVSSEGINLKKFTYDKDMSYEVLNFIFVGRLVKEKGLCDFLEAALLIKNDYQNVNFYISGPIYEKDSSINLEVIKKYEVNNCVKYLGFSYDMNKVYEKMHAVVLPSYREGMPMSLIEGFAKGKIAIASNVPGCIDVVDNNINGFIFKVKDVDSLVEAISKYVNLSIAAKKQMSINAYKKAKFFYDESIIIPEIINIIEME